jgi:hypothetical protein
MRSPLHALGLTLILLGAGLWLGTGREQATALIPAYLGAVMVLLALAASRPGVQRSALRGGLLLALIGAAGGLAMGGPKLVQAMQGATLERPYAVAGQVAMGVFCLLYVLAAWKRR